MASLETTLTAFYNGREMANTAKGRFGNCKSWFIILHYGAAPSLYAAIILFTSLYQDMEQGEVSFCIDSYTLLNQYESGDKPLPNNLRNSNGVAPIVASGYGNHRFGVTAIVASGLRQSSLQNIGKHGCLLMFWMPVFWRLETMPHVLICSPN